MWAAETTSNLVRGILVTILVGSGKTLVGVLAFLLPVFTRGSTAAHSSSYQFQYSVFA